MWPAGIAKISLTALLLLSSIIGGCIRAEAASGLPEVVLGVEDSWPPYADKNGEGISVELVRAALQSVGQPVVFEVRPYARVLREVESGKLDGGFNVTRQSSTEARFVFGHSPLLVAKGSYYFAPQRVLAFSAPDQIPDGTRVGTIIGYEYGNQYELNRARFSESRVGNQRQIIKMLMAGRLDVAVMFDRVAAYTLAEMDLPSNVLRKGATNHSSDIYVVFSRVNPLAKEYARMLDLGLQRIKESGKYALIVNNND